MSQNWSTLFSNNPTSIFQDTDVLCLSRLSGMAWESFAFAYSDLKASFVPLTTKGDIYTWSTLPARLPVGTNGQFLWANSAVSTGLQWRTITLADLTSVPISMANGGTNTTSIATGMVKSTGTALALAVGGVDYATATHTHEYATDNVHIGNSALASFTSGTDNVAAGHNALTLLTIGLRNIAIGSFSLDSTLDGNDNVAIGYNTLTTNTTGGENIAIGSNSLQSNTTGGDNIAIGPSALNLNTTGFVNMGIGFAALQNNTIGSENTAIGILALQNNIDGGRLTALGIGSLTANTSGNNNTGLGFRCLEHLANGSNNLGVGYTAGGANTSGDNNIYMGSDSFSHGNSSESNVTIIGNSSTTFTAISGINGIAPAVTDGQVVICNSSQQLGSISSGTAGYVLTSNGTSAEPSFQAPSVDPLPLVASKGGTGIDASALTGLIYANASETMEAISGDIGSVLLQLDGAGQLVALNPGNSGEVITSNGGGFLPTYQPLPSGGIISVNVTTSSAAMVKNHLYINNVGGTCSLTLPVTAAVGDVFYIVCGASSGTWHVTQNASQIIILPPNIGTNTGVTGYIESTGNTDAVMLVCITANIRFNCSILSGTIFYN